MLCESSCLYGQEGKLQGALPALALDDTFLIQLIGKRALECSQSALKLDDSNKKAKFREAQARIGFVLSI